MLFLLGSTEPKINLFELRHPHLKIWRNQAGTTSLRTQRHAVRSNRFWDLAPLTENETRATCSHDHGVVFFYGSAQLPKGATKTVRRQPVQRGLGLPERWRQAIPQVSERMHRRKGFSSGGARGFSKENRKRRQSGIPSHRSVVAKATRRRYGVARFARPSKS